MKTYVPTQGPTILEREELREVVEWLERELQGIKSALDTAFDLNLEDKRTTASGQRLKDREGMFRYVPDPTLDLNWAQEANVQYYHDNQWLGVAEQTWTKSTCMQWKNEWQSGQQYFVNEVVLDFPWLMIANKSTYDRPAPQPSGDPAYTVPDVPAWTPGLDPGWVWTGNLYTMQQNGWVEAVRVWIPTADTGRVHRLLVLEWIDIPTNNYRILLNILIPSSAFAVGWYTVQTDIFWLVGNQYEVAILSENIGDPALGFQGVWQYAGASQSGDPYWGGWNHNNQHTTIRFHEQQADGLGSAAPYLTNLGPGDTVTITTASATWTYDISSAPSISGQIYSYSCTRTLASGSISSGEACTVEWGTPGVAPDVEYVSLSGHWTTNEPSWASSVVGVIDTETDPGAGRTTSDDAHGADVLFQVGYVSPDWDFMSASPTN